MSYKQIENMPYPLITQNLFLRNSEQTHNKIVLALETSPETETHWNGLSHSDPITFLISFATLNKAFNMALGLKTQEVYPIV
jgi:hypothetical protein